eukprot:4031646-Amphidinium_carterae.2
MSGRLPSLCLAVRRQWRRQQMSGVGGLRPFGSYARWAPHLRGKNHSASATYAGNGSHFAQSATHHAGRACCCDAIGRFRDSLILCFYPSLVMLLDVL